MTLGKPTEPRLNVNKIPSPTAAGIMDTNDKNFSLPRARDAILLGNSGILTMNQESAMRAKGKEENTKGYSTVVHSNPLNGYVKATKAVAKSAKPTAMSKYPLSLNGFPW